MIQEKDRGHLIVPVKVVDDSQTEPVQVEMEWAWIPKSSKK